MDKILPLLSDPEVYVSLLVLSLMEIVLGIDNIVFITILTGRLPKHQQLGARRLGLAVALITRLGLLTAISWVMRLEETLFTLVVPLSGKDLILIGGGTFLLYKATHEIFVNVDHPSEPAQEVVEDAQKGVKKPGGPSMFGIIMQIMVLDIVFSLDSVITAVGMAQHIPIMIVAVMVAAAMMLAFSGPISNFVHRHPTMKMLALSFLILIGVMLVAEAFGQHVDKGYIYFAMAFSLGVEFINMRLRAKGTPVDLRHSELPTEK